MTFDSQGLQNGGGDAQVLQLIDRETLKVVWTQALARIPQLASRIGGVQLQADGVRGGFYLRNGYVAPVLYIDNAGQTLYDFTAGRGSTGPHPSSHPGGPGKHQHAPARHALFVGSPVGALECPLSINAP